MSNYFYYQAVGGEEDWKAVPAASIDHIRIELQPMFITVLSVSKLVEDLSYEDKMKLAYDGPMYFDFDSTDEQLVIEKVNQFLNKLESLKVDLSMIRLYATGGRGYHIEIPQGVFMAKPKPVTNLPAIYREIALDLCVDTLDLRVYSQGRGRMWRQCGVKRDNGRYKVPISVAEMRAMTPEACQQLTSTPRQPIGVTAPKLCIDLSILYDRCAQKVEDLFKKRLKFKPDPAAKEKAYCDSIQWMMAGLGLKPGVGFQEISTQLAIAASTAGLTEDQFIADCQGIIDNHVGNGNRYDSPAKRSDELRRMYRYMYGNLCYEFSVGAIKSLLIHPAPDLDGIHMTKEEVAEVIKEAEAEDKADVDEYSDVAKGLSMTKFGVYVDTELGKKRVCAMSFTRSAILKSIENGQISGYETDVLVNGKFAGRQTLELDVFSGLVPFNRFAARYGHAFQGTDAHVRILMMRFVEDAKKKGEEKYIVQREGLDVVHIPHHPNPVFREEFLTWSDSEGVVMPEHVTSEGLNLTFAGYPDPRGVYKTDIRDAPNLAEWIKEGDNKQELLLTLRSLITCQKSELLGKLIGWYTACYWRQLFHKVYGKFPLMHVNGGAGSGKTEMSMTIANLFYYKQDVKSLTPGSTPFAMQQHLTASSSIPLIFDEYKPHEMNRELHNKMKAIFRDAYNQKELSRGGGSRESSDYRILQTSQLSAPIVFIAEATEEEAAVMERVVLATVVKPPSNEGAKWLSCFQIVCKNRHMLGILGKYIASKIVATETLASLRTSFDNLYDEARREFMVTAEDLAGGISEEALRDKQMAKERSVFNHTVAKFGLLKFSEIVRLAVGKELDAELADLEAGIYTRMKDLQAATTPEYVKVLIELASMSYHVDDSSPQAIRKNQEYAFINIGGIDCIELAVRPAYFKYRAHCATAKSFPLFSGYDPFAYGLKDSPAFHKFGIGDALKTPNVFVFKLEELARLGVPNFKA